MINIYKCSTNNQRFVDGDISQIRTLLKSDCNIINLHLETNYNFDRNNKYKYYNPNLIRNNGQIKKDQTLHCDFKTSNIPCSNITKNNLNIVQTTVNPKKRKSNRQKT